MLSVALLRASQIRVYKRAGMIDAVVAMQQEMQKSHEEYNKEREAREQKLLRQKTLGMEMRQKARPAQLQTSQEAEMDELRRSQRKEYAALVDAQATETHELTEMITGMIALGAAWAPTEKTNRPWIAQLKSQDFVLPGSCQTYRRTSQRWRQTVGCRRAWRNSSKKRML